MLFGTACGENGGAEVNANQNGFADEPPVGPEEFPDEPPDDPEELCELACQRVYSLTSDGGCQQQFLNDEGVAVNEASCVEECIEEDLLGDADPWCIATEVDCQSQPREMIELCLPEDYHLTACDELGDWEGQVAALEKEVLELVNELRAEGVECPVDGYQPATDPVEVDMELRCAARAHSKDMAERGYFAHDSPEGESPGDRVAQTAYQGSFTGENIAQGASTAEDVVDMWLGSTTGHCENMLNPVHDHLGVGMYNNYWTQKFGAQ